MDRTTNHFKLFLFADSAPFFGAKLTPRRLISLSIPSHPVPHSTRHASGHMPCTSHCFSRPSSWLAENIPEGNSHRGAVANQVLRSGSPDALQHRAAIRSALARRSNGCQSSGGAHAKLSFEFTQFPLSNQLTKPFQAGHAAESGGQQDFRRWADLRT
jgi:hypothetical protein